MGWWAYRTMDTLGLTPDAIGGRVGVDPATIRKFQGSPTGQLGAESRARLLAFYREVAAAKGIPIDEPPSGFITAGPSVSDGLGSADLASAIRDLVAELRESRRERNSIEARLRALEAAAKLRAESDDEAPLERSTPLGSAR